MPSEEKSFSDMSSDFMRPQFLTMKSAMHLRPSSPKLFLEKFQPVMLVVAGHTWQNLSICALVIPLPLNLQYVAVCAGSWTAAQSPCTVSGATGLARALPRDGSALRS